NRRGAAKEVGRREQALTRFRDRLVAADVIRIGAGIDHVSNRPRGDLLDRGDDRTSCRRRTSIDDHYTIVSDLDADVAAGAGDHEEVGAELEYFEIAGLC